MTHTLTSDRTQMTESPQSISSIRQCFPNNSPSKIPTGAIRTEVPRGTREDLVRLFAQRTVSLVSSCSFAFPSLNIGRGSTGQLKLVGEDQATGTMRGHVT